ncbi:MAG: hypothetical protein ABIY55_12685, partial [Kofleriaceae bacterium]
MIGCVERAAQRVEPGAQVGDVCAEPERGRVDAGRLEQDRIRRAGGHHLALQRRGLARELQVVRPELVGARPSAPIRASSLLQLAQLLPRVGAGARDELHGKHRVCGLGLGERAARGLAELRGPRRRGVLVEHRHPGVRTIRGDPVRAHSSLGQQLHHLEHTGQRFADDRALAGEHRPPRREVDRSGVRQRGPPASDEGASTVEDIPERPRRELRPQLVEHHAGRVEGVDELHPIGRDRRSVARGRGRRGSAVRTLRHRDRVAERAGGELLRRRAVEHVELHAAGLLAVPGAGELARPFLRDRDVPADQREPVGIV